MFGMNVKKGCYYKGTNRDGTAFIYYIIDVSEKIQKIRFKIVIDKDSRPIRRMLKNYVGTITGKPRKCFTEAKRVKEKDVIWEVL